MSLHVLARCLSDVSSQVAVLRNSCDIRDRCMASFRNALWMLQLSFCVFPMFGIASSLRLVFSLSRLLFVSSPLRLVFSLSRLLFVSSSLRLIQCVFCFFTRCLFHAKTVSDFWHDDFQKRGCVCCIGCLSRVSSAENASLMPGSTLPNWATIPMFCYTPRWQAVVLALAG